MREFHHLMMLSHHCLQQHSNHMCYGNSYLLLHMPFLPLFYYPRSWNYLLLLVSLTFASSFVTCLIQLKLGSIVSCPLNFEGSFRKASILPHIFSILARVIGLFKTFSSRVNHRRFSGRLFCWFVSIWSTTCCFVGGSPWNAYATILCTRSPASSKYPVLSSFFPKV